MTLAPDMSATTIDAHLEHALRRPSWTIWLVTASVFAFILWAGFAWVDEIVRADGEVVSQSRPQIIQNLEGGILAELSVKEGDMVAPGTILARLHSTAFQSNVDDLQDQINALDIRRMRLEAEMEGQSEFPVPEAVFVRNPEIVASEQALLRARQGDFQSRAAGAKSVLDQAAQELSLLENLLERKVVSLIEVTRARKAHGDAKARYDEVVTQMQLERAGAYSDTLKEIATLKQNLKLSQDQLNRTTLVSPMRGIVNNLSVTTIGGVVRPGEEIAQIIPLDEEMLIEAQVAPEDIANVKRGQAATIKLSAYDYTIYGSLEGRVQFISADTFKDDRVVDGDPHYRVTVSVDRSKLTARQRAVEIRPGMRATVELQTGAKTILQYLLKPLYKSKEAFREP
ncbi:HlyD family efflux transporter periplasmic adaptor subunit [Shimia ponticola]|uniref:HlyD family efflux transporter periplasmic adaptor subunit n=1 Tax=Shimia ponticola TaxID=2582893 RepID=UPI00210803E6|nr:HlyD family efflux transporter periplasmic adaptor subunit [Shimia ponticola]